MVLYPNYAKIYEDIEYIPKLRPVYLEDRLNQTIKKVQMLGGCDHWTTFYDGNVSKDHIYDENVYSCDYNDYEYNRLWRCWYIEPSCRQRKNTPWRPINVRTVYDYLTKYRIQAIEACKEEMYSDDYQREYDKAIVLIRELIGDSYNGSYNRL